MLRVHLRNRRLGAGLLAFLVAVVGTVTLAVLGAPTASSTGTQGKLVIVSVQDAATGLEGAVAGDSFSVVVESRTRRGAPLPVKKDTKVELSEVSGPGTLTGTTSAVILKGTFRTTITGAVYSTFGNGIVLQVAVTSGDRLAAARATTNVASSVVKAVATPGVPINVFDPGCKTPTPASPVCGYLKLPNGANGTILLSLGSCVGFLDCLAGAGPVPGLATAEVQLKDANGQPLYTKKKPATFILACDKTVCGNRAVRDIQVLIDVTNVGAFATAPPCPARGVLGADQQFCLDKVLKLGGLYDKEENDFKVKAGDVFSFILFDHDIRGSYP